MACRRIQIENPRIAIVLLTLYGFGAGCLSTYIVSMLSTIEKRFEWPSSRVGLLLSADDIGYLATVLPVAYFGGKGRHSLVLCLSSLLLFCAAALRAAPILIFGPKFTKDQILSISQQRGNLTESPTDKFLPNFAQQQLWGFVIQFASGVLHGIANTPFWNVGAALIDDMAGRDSGPYLGFLFLIRTMSPIVGFLLGGQLTTLNEGLVLKASDFAQGLKDPLWVGAWWLGILGIGCLVLLNTPLLALLNVKKLQEAGERDRARATSGERPPVLVPNVDYLGSVTSLAAPNDDDTGQLDLKKLSLSELLKYIKELYTNPVFVFLYIGSVFEFAAFVIFIGYFPKYIEYHFSVNAKEASLMSAVSLAGGSALAVIIGSVITKVYPMPATHMNLYHAVANAVAALLFPLLFLFRCEQAEIVGPHNFAEKLAEAGLDACIDAASCSRFTYDPVCIDRVTFMSPCLAGCSKVEVDNVTLQTNCLCSNVTGSPGVCAANCSSVHAYLALFFVTRVIGTMAAVHFTLILMRLPRTREVKPLAMGLISFIFGIMGVITPPIAGKLIDTACIVQNPSESGRSFCLFYDTDKFRNIMHGVGSSFQLPSCLLFFLSYWCSRTRYPVASDPVTLGRRHRLQREAEAVEELHTPSWQRYELSCYCLEH